MPNPRVAKLADQIQMIVAEMLERRVKDPRLGFVTITDVRLTGDTREATIFYTVLSQDASGADLAGTAAALESAKGMLRSTVGKRLGLRHAPSLTFVLDASLESAKSIEDALARAAASDQQVSSIAAGAQFAGEADPYRKPHEDDDLDDADLDDADLDDADLDDADDDADGTATAGSDEGRDA